MVEIKFCPSTLAEGYNTYSTGHPCRLDFERFGAQIGLTGTCIKRVLDKYIPELTTKLVGNSFLNDMMKRKYLRIVDERVKRFVRKSE